jgi:hypothetical protein
MMRACVRPVTSVVAVGIFLMRSRLAARSAFQSLSDASLDPYNYHADDRLQIKLAATLGSRLF